MLFSESVTQTMLVHNSTGPYQIDIICGCVAVPVNLFFDIISSCFSRFKNVVQFGVR